MSNLPKIIWITGLSGAGKTTLARELVTLLRKASSPVVLLDGDELREILTASISLQVTHDRSSRLDLAMRYSQLCKLIASQGVTVVIATISMFKEIHEWNRKNLPGYFEVYLKVPKEELRRRDPKKIYERFDAGELVNVAGFDLAIDEPNAADWVIDFTPSARIELQADELCKRITEKR
jgi:cytidine diphosphoramidate kinase